ncbi:hypothetical protein PSR1_02826 [Anaeromyxobacter sp. PSR-1]|nr:hypothetical protein PSR1_02826 [Anaeromyxobacter sp. PSR-1]
MGPSPAARGRPPRSAAFAGRTSSVAKQATYTSGRHAPSRQLSPRSQRTPQAPQFHRSDDGSAHAPPQDSCPAGQALAQTPPAQTWPVPQALPQAPQLAGSDDRSTQPPPHSTVPGPHSHAPALHSWYAPQAVPHAPQFEESISTEVQAPPQTCSPAAQTSSWSLLQAASASAAAARAALRAGRGIRIMGWGLLASIRRAG